MGGIVSNTDSTFNLLFDHLYYTSLAPLRLTIVTSISVVNLERIFPSIFCLT